MSDLLPQRIGTEFLVNTTTEGHQDLPTITSLTNSDFVVTWVDGSGLTGDSPVVSIQAQVLDGTGAKVGSEFLVTTKTAGSLDSPTVTGLNNGSFVVTWTDYSSNLGWAIEAQLFAGAKIGGEFQVSSLRDGGIRYVPHRHWT